MTKDGCAEDDEMITTMTAAAEPRVFRPWTMEPGTGWIKQWQRLWVMLGCGNWPLAAADDGDQVQ